MTSPVRALLWNRLDTTGTDLALVDEHRGLTVRGRVVAAAPIPYTCRYEFTTDDDLRVRSVQVESEGAGWRRHLTVDRVRDGWRVTGGEKGDLDRSLVRAGRTGADLAGIDDPDRIEPGADVHLARSPIFATPAVRRALAAAAPTGAPPNTTATAWILTPSLQVIPTAHVFTAGADGSVEVRGDTMTTTLTVDADGFVVRWPGLAELTAGPA